jgi:transposase
MISPESELLARLEKMEQALAALAIQNETLRSENARLEAENKLLRARIDKLVRRIFGRSSEKISPEQLELLLQFPEDSSLGKSLASPCHAAPGADTWEAQPTSRSAQQPTVTRRPRLPEHLPVVETVIEPDEVKAAPDEWRCIGEEVSEHLDYEPARFLRRRTVRPKYVRRGDNGQPPVIAPLPPSLQAAGIAAPGLIAAVAVAKYCDHLPLYRQEQIYRTRHGVHLPRQTLSRFLTLAAFWLRPLYEQIKTTVLDGGYVQMDETPIKYLEPGNGQTLTGYLWTMHRPGGDTCYAWHPGRAAECLDAMIPDHWHGILQSDGYGAYRSFVRSRGGRTDAPIVLGGCMAHARRKFHEARNQGGTICLFIIRQMQNLYHIEATLRSARSSPRIRVAVRAECSRPIMARLHRLCAKLQETRRFLPRSEMGQAIAYLLNQWQHLSQHLEDGRMEIDNNLVENAIRPTAIGKKNWLFVGTETAGETTAILYTVIEYARRRGIDPQKWLRRILDELPRMKIQEVPRLLAPDSHSAARHAA